MMGIIGPYFCNTVCSAKCVPDLFQKLQTVKKKKSDHFGISRWEFVADM